MKRTFHRVIIVAAVALLLSPSQVMAQEMILQSNGDTTIDQLRMNCDTIRSTLRRLHTNDAPLRVNLGQSYNAISSQLMARLNSRLALNRIDSSSLVDITGTFERQRTEFSARYSEYEAALSSLLKIDCNARPTEFYATLLKVRDARNALSVTVQSMNESVREYQVAVELLQQTLRTDGGNDGN